MNHIREIYKNSFDKSTELIFTSETLESRDETGTSSINIQQIVEISEIEKYYFLHIRDFGRAIILPKEKAQNLSEVANAIKEIADKFNIKYNVDLNWKWK